MVADGRISHGVWVAVGRPWIDYLGMEWPLAADEACFYQSFTPKEVRTRASQRDDTVIRRALEILREDGLLALCFRILGETVYRRVLVMGTDLANAPTRPDARCRWLEPNEAADYARCDSGIPAEAVRRRMSAGQRCFVLWSSDHQIASGVWVACGRAWIDYLQMELPLNPGEAYLFQSYTSRQQRGRGNSTAVLLAVRDALLQQGCVRTIGCIQPDRSIAYPPLFRSGVTPRGYLGWFRLGPWHWTFRRSTDHFPFYAPRPTTRAPENP